VPFLKKIFEQGQAAAGEVSAEEYAAGRAGYIREGKGTPPEQTGDRRQET
jgi:hypothetical protein